MLEEISKNVWLLFTVILPGLFTYGTWRIVLSLQPKPRIGAAILAQADTSAILTGAYIIAIALSQQAIAIAVEGGFTLLARHYRTRWRGLYALFCLRFRMAATSRLKPNALTIVANFFLSLNITIGLALLLLYFSIYEGLGFDDTTVLALTGLLLSSMLAAGYRLWVAQDVIQLTRTR